jgi:hypothetical protein
MCMRFLGEMGKENLKADILLIEYQAEHCQR